MERASAYDHENGKKKGAWSKEEDDKLRAYVLKYGHWNWSQLPRFAGLSRCGKSCRLRWMNYLRPGVKFGNYTKEEDAIIIKLHEEHGNKWTLIAAKLKGRTDNEIKNYWNTHLKKRKKKDTATMEEVHSNGKTSQSEANQIGEVESQSINLVDTPLQESYPMSPLPSTGDFSSSISDQALLGSAINWVTNEGREPFKAMIGDFWTEPFIADNVYFQNYYSSSSLTNGGFLLPYDSYNEDSLHIFY